MFILIDFLKHVCIVNCEVVESIDLSDDLFAGIVFIICYFVSN